MSSKPVKVLYFVDRMLRGGIQSLVIDWVSRFDKEKVHVDFLLLDDGNKYELEDTLKELGCNVYKLKDMWIRKPQDFFKYAKMLDLFFEKHHDYKIVHLHSTSKNYMVLKYAKRYNIPIRIAHSHSIDFQTKSTIKKITGNILKPKLIKYSTNYFACSKIAGKWLFGDKIVNSDKFKVIHNAVDYEKFKFDTNVREQIRKKFEFKNEDIVIGHVGRFTNPKNHTFLIDIFYECYKENNNYKLLLIGTGELEDAIKNKVKKLEIDNNVIFAGFRTDVNKCMQAMDIFLLPSLYEGLPLVAVEAQVSGLPCFISEGTITNEVKIANNVWFISLQKDAKTWADSVLRNNNERVNNYIKLKEKGYILDDIVHELENFYVREVKNFKYD